MSEQPKKTGRRKSAAPHDQRLAVYYTREQMDIVQQKMIAARTDLQSYMRGMTLHGKVIARLSPEETVILITLIGMANNLHELSNLAKKESLLTVALQFEAYRVKIDNLINKIENVR